MRTLTAVSLALAACLAAALPARVAAAPLIVLTDPGYPLWEIRPLDRHVYVLTLEGDWKGPPDPDAAYYVNVEFPNGGAVSHRVLDNRIFWRGDVQCLLMQYQWEKNHFQEGDKLNVFLTRKQPGAAGDDQDVVSNRLEVAWPFDRKVVRLEPRTRFAPREPIDAFHPQGDEPLKPPTPVIPPMPPPAGDEPLKPPKPAPPDK